MEDNSINALKEKVNSSAHIDEKIRLVIDFMKMTLSLGGTPRFKDFWDAKQLALELFKEKLNPISRANYWKEYTELTQEAKRLKSILDEQAAFAIEQIELALEAFEKDIATFEETIDRLPPLTLPKSAVTLIRRVNFYDPIQRELSFLNTLALRLTGLRKEVIATDMRIRTKNQILERLSQLGDKIFPRRKELIRSVSEAFSEDVETFVAENFATSGEKMRPIFQLREEIKVFQEMAKKLTINTAAFQMSRKHLSECWDKLREMDKERRKDFSEKKEIFKANFEKMKETISSFKENVDSKSLTMAQIQETTTSILATMKEMELSRDGVKALKDELFAITRAQEDLEKEKRLEREKQLAKEAEKRREHLESVHKTWHEKLDALTDSATITESLDALQKELSELNLKGSESAPFDELILLAQDRASLEHERALFKSKEINETLLADLEAALKGRLKMRKTIKNELEQLRKEEGSSGLDFEKAMLCRDLTDKTRVRLTQVEEAIAQLEAKIDEITL